MVERLKDFSSLVAFKFDIGAVYSLPVSEKDTFQTAFKPEQKELVFDIDMNDYDDIRTCCKDKQVCQKCWRFLDIAMRLLDGALREDFGYEHLLWIFSGRRGVHCWVCDSTARLLPSDGRASVCEYLNLCTGTSQQMKKINLRGKVQPYSVDRAFTLAYRQFYSLLVEQDFFSSSSSPPSSSSIESQSIPHYRAVLNYLPDNSHEGNSDSSHQHSYSNRGRYSNISRGEGKGGGAHFSSTVSSSCRDHMCKWIEKRKREGGFSSLEFFNEICMLSGSILPKAFAERSDCEGFRAGEEETKNFPSYLKEIVLAYSYPRLDINV
ncbi:dna primase small subunit, partial [Cystoisospora suis]